MSKQVLDNLLKRTAVLGAGGKMGSGISLLLLQEMCRLEAAQTGKVGAGIYRLVLIDSNEEAFFGLRNYLRDQMRRYAERQINLIRQWFVGAPHLVSNREMIESVVQGAIDSIRFEKDVEQGKGSHLIFEAIAEDPVVKIEVFKRLRGSGDSEALFFTNTSSIPIGALSAESGLKGRLIGYHFYNPPVVQKLIEIIPAQDTPPAFISLAEELAKRLGKMVIFSKDVAGFIGNGHFLREIDLALKEVAQREKERGSIEALCLVNQITQELLLRPMGIFQLIDYVGIDVLQRVMKIMTRYLHLSFHSSLIDQMAASGHLGGQHPDGSQKPGFFRYEGHVPKEVFSLEKGKYVPLPGDLLGKRPEGNLSWKSLVKKKEKEKILQEYFENLVRLETPAAQLAAAHLFGAREIARNLVKEGVAHRIEDVNAVMMNGFYHLYGPDATWLPQEVLR